MTSSEHIVSDISFRFITLNLILSVTAGAASLVNIRRYFLTPLLLQSFCGILLAIVCANHIEPYITAILEI